MPRHCTGKPTPCTRDRGRSATIGVFRIPRKLPKLTLRTRLVLALVLLTTLGLAAFGLATYSLYQRSLFKQLDQQLADLARPQGTRLTNALRDGRQDVSCDVTDQPIGEPGVRGSRPDGFGPGQGVDAFSALFVNGELVACVSPITTTGRPAVSGSLARSDEETYRTVGSSVGSGSWRVLATPVTPLLAPVDPLGDHPKGPVVVVAVRTAGLEESLDQLLRIELIAAAGLLGALALGSWLVLRSGLRPLETMSASASTITAGALSDRVAPADDRTEVGRLGLALNTMLDGLEDSFREREATERRLRQFLADASHELRTPITSIQGFAELFRLAGDNGEMDLPVVMRRIEQESARMRTLVQDLFLLAELDETRPAATAQVDLTVLAADACTDAAATAPDRRVTLDGPAPVVVQGNSDHLRQAIANLVSNALQHTPPGSSVEISTRVTDGWAQVTVRDHGSGLAPDGLVHAFDRFWQADAARVGTGSGLGLSIVSGIAAEHGGRASVVNVAGGGAAFTLSLPPST